MQQADDLQRNIVLSEVAIQLSKSDNKKPQRIKITSGQDIRDLNITLKIGISKQKVYNCIAWVCMSVYNTSYSY